MFSILQMRHLERAPLISTGWKAGWDEDVDATLAIPIPWYDVLRKEVF
jgi:hypothetical protein